MIPEARIAEALAEHWPSTVRLSDAVRGHHLDRCMCGKVTGDERGHAAHQAEVIAALPDIAIVDKGLSHTEWGAQLDANGCVETIVCEDRWDAEATAADNKAWASTIPREVVTRTVVRSEWRAAEGGS